MSKPLIEQLLKKYSKPELAVIRSTFFVVNHVIDAYLLNGIPLIDTALKEMREYQGSYSIHPNCSEMVNLPGFQSGFETGYAYGLALIQTDNLNTIATVESAIKEGISRG